MKLRISATLYRLLGQRTYDLTEDERQQLEALDHCLQAATPHTRQRGGGQVRTDYDILLDAGGIEQARHLLVHLDAITLDQVGVAPKQRAAARKAITNMLAKVDGPGKALVSNRRAKVVKLKAEAATKTTKQERRRVAAKADSEAGGRLGVPRMQQVTDKDGATVLVVARRAGQKDGRMQYYVRILGSDLGLRREALADGVAGYARLARGIARARDEAKPVAATRLGQRLREEGMAVS